MEGGPWAYGWMEEDWRGGGGGGLRRILYVNEHSRHGLGTAALAESGGGEKEGTHLAILQGTGEEPREENGGIACVGVGVRALV
jgi:hypothetical protein